MRRSSLVVAFVLVLGALTVPAFATHDPVQTLKGSPNGPATDVAFGLDANGQATAAWTEGGYVYVATRPSGKHFGPSTEILGPHASTFAFDEADNGNAVLAVAGGMNEGRLAVSIRLGSGGFSEPQYLLDPNARAANFIDAAVSESGHAAVVWETDNILYGALSGASGTFGTPVQLDTSTNTPSAAVDLDDDGNGLVTYDWQGPDGTDEIRAIPIVVGSFSATTTIDTMGQGPGLPHVAVNGRGDAVVVWADFTEDTNSCGAVCKSRDILEASYGDVSGTFGPLQEITDPLTATAAGDHEAAIDDAGVAALLFNLTLPGPTYGLYASVSDASGTFPANTFQTITPHDYAGGPGIDYRYFEIAAGGGGFTAFWSNDHDEDDVNEAWYASTSAGTFGTVHQMSPDSTEDAIKVTGDRNGAGQIIEGWNIFIPESNASIQAGPVAAGNPPTFGTSGDDDLTGTSGDDVVFLAAGNDSYNGAGGNDEVYGQAGNDKLAGAAGNDKLIGGGGKDNLNGGPGKDVLNGGPGKDTCRKTKGDRLKSCEKVVGRRHI